MTISNLQTMTPAADLESYSPSRATAARSTGQDAQPVSANESTPLIPTGNLYDALDATLDLSQEGRNLSGLYTSLDPAERGQYVSLLADLLKQGVVGTETLEVNGAPYKSFVSTRLGDECLRHAAPYRAQTGISPRLDLRG